MNDTIFTITLISTIILVFLRYAVRYLWKRDEIRHEISYMNDKLSSSKDIEKEIISLSNFRKKAVLTYNDYIVRDSFLVNSRYKKVVEEYDCLEEYNKKFWKLEGIIYVIVIVISSYFLL